MTPKLRPSSADSMPQGFIQDFWLGGGNLLVHQRSAEMWEEGVGGIPLPAPPHPPQIFFVDLASLAKFDKFNAYAHQGCI